MKPRSFNRRTLALANHHAAIAGADHVYFVDTAQDRGATRAELEGLADLAVVGDQFWIAAGAPPQLHRFDRSGAPLGAPLALPGGDGVLRATAVGPPGAVWTAESTAVVAAEGALTPIAGEVDCVIPVALGRWLTCRRERVALRDAGTERWRVSVTGGDHVLDGAVLFGGSSAALVLGRALTPTRLAVISLRDGAFQYRVALTAVEQP